MKRITRNPIVGFCLLPTFGALMLWLLMGTPLYSSFPPLEGTSGEAAEAEQSEPASEGEDSADDAGKMRIGLFPSRGGRHLISVVTIVAPFWLVALWSVFAFKPKQEGRIGNDAVE